MGIAGHPVPDWIIDGKRQNNGLLPLACSRPTRFRLFWWHRLILWWHRICTDVAQSARLAEDTSHIGLQGGYQASRIDGVWRYPPTGDSSVNIPRGD
jgi:hypothetical protein